MSFSATTFTYSAQGKAHYGPRGSGHPNQNRDALVLEHAGMVRRVALHLADRLDGAVDPDDLIQTGLLGLLEATDRYSPMEGIPFEAYALPRARGAMLDSLRKNDWCPRNLRGQGRKLQTAKAELQQKLSRKPTGQELAQASGMTLDECRKTEAQLEVANMASLESLLEKGDSPLSLELPLETEDVASPLVKQRLKRSLVSAIKQLPEREQMIMQLYYNEELNQKEIARVLDLTEARISQLRSKAVKTLQRKLSQWM